MISEPANKGMKLSKRGHDAGGPASRAGINQASFAANAQRWADEISRQHRQEGGDRACQ
jgi:hypothetical protein